MSAAAAHASPPAHNPEKAVGTSPELVHNVEHPENGVTPPTGNLHSVPNAPEGSDLSWKEIAKMPFNALSSRIKRLLVGASPAVADVIGETREAVGGVLGKAWETLKQTGEMIRRNAQLGIYRLDSSSYTMLDKENNTIFDAYFGQDLRLDRDVVFRKGSYIMGPASERGPGINILRRIRNRFYGPQEGVHDAVTGADIPVGKVLEKDLVVKAGTLIGRGTRMRRGSHFQGQTHHEMTDLDFNTIIEHHGGRFTHNWTLDQPENRPYRLPVDLKLGGDIPNGLGFNFTDQNGANYGPNQRIPKGTVIPTGCQIRNHRMIPYNTMVIKADEVDTIPEERLKKTIVLKEKITLKSPLRVGAPMRIGREMIDNSVNPPVRYAARALLPTGAVIARGTELDKDTKISAGSELMAVVESLNSELLKRWVMLEKDFILPADLQLGADLPQGVSCEFNSYSDPDGNPLPVPIRIHEHTSLPRGKRLPAGLKLPAGTVLPAGSHFPEEIEEANINSDVAQRFDRIRLSELGEPLTERARLRAPTRVVGWLTLQRDVYLGEGGILIPKQYGKKIKNPVTGENYEMVDIHYKFNGNKFNADNMDYVRIIPENYLYTGTVIPDGTIILGGAFLACPSHGEQIPAGRLKADFTLMPPAGRAGAIVKLGGPLTLGRVIKNPTGKKLTIDAVDYGPNDNIPGGKIIPKEKTLVVPVAGLLIPGGSEITTPKIDLEKAVLEARRLVEDKLRTDWKDETDIGTILGQKECKDCQKAIDALPVDKRIPQDESFNKLIKAHCVRVLFKKAQKETQKAISQFEKLPKGYKQTDVYTINGAACATAEIAIGDLEAAEAAEAPETVLSRQLRARLESAQTKARTYVTK